MKIYQERIQGAPQFVSYFKPVVDTLRNFGGQAKPRDVYASIADEYGVPDDVRDQLNLNGQPKFENRVAWARFYLMKAGLIYAPQRGVWALTDSGKTADLPKDDALSLFKAVQTRFRGKEDDEAAPEDEVVPEGMNYWFVGAMWDEGDQSQSFLTQGIWQNGYEDKFSALVRQMKAGDKIAIKSSYVRKRSVPFENRGRAVSAMKIKAIGTITGNRGDGLTVDVDWEEPIDPPREWYLYTYRTTVARARFEDDEMARRLVAFAFEGADQDYAHFLAQPYWVEKFAAEAEPLSLIENDVGHFEEDAAEVVTFTVEDIIAEGGFLPGDELHSILKRLKIKKNLILQGPPGTGKTWLAKRLAKALIGQKLPSSDQLRSVQFHPSLSYEDFIRGYRPNADGRLTITDGLFLQVVEAAKAQPDLPHVLIIEEINRGNPAQVFGEMLTLIENTKRSRSEAMELAYRKQPGERVHVPDNLYIIGTMNIADRSLALVDLALRRRFAFVTLEPALNEAWRGWCERHRVAPDTIRLIQLRMEALNTHISKDRTLGPQFRIGHSFVTPFEVVSDSRVWFREIVDTEIRPLLEEYWFDAADRAREAIYNLLEDL
ncbi:AAA family ATPase [Rhizobium leguminosarum]|uniref:AAA family ATPase n=1 Tax=Rhizobium leguminosarum TaxID=384 RepID=UPI00102F6DDB|nr:AAA family ATPase [Rhizobium leguminosarum]TAY64906.1 AAA family ATPase [Rhizobium leguminosarum]